MATGLVHYMYCLVLLTSFVDRGDGRWKRKDRENLQKDIELFRNMADKIEYEIETFYEEYPNEELTSDLDGLRYRYTGRTLDNVEASKVGHHAVKQDVPLLTNETNEILTPAGTLHKPVIVSKAKPVNINFSSVIKSPDLNENRKSAWPKFDDILLKMGKQYDWKNDRWIKVKRKIKNDKIISHSNLDFHVKHKFYYRIVKLNKSKARRNVVVAVSAVR